MTTTDPFHVHPRSKRTAKSPYKPLFKPLVPVKAGTSQARKANTYRGHPERIIEKLPVVPGRFRDTSRYTADNLPAIRAEKGVGRPVVTKSR